MTFERHLVLIIKRKTYKFAFDEMTPSLSSIIYRFFFLFMYECKIDLNKPAGKHFRNNALLPGPEYLGFECV